MAGVSYTVTCRKAFLCDDMTCGRTIQPGEDYVRSVTFPWDDMVNQSPDIWVFKACRVCATRYGLPMPPRRTRRKVSA